MRRGFLLLLITLLFSGPAKCEEKIIGVASTIDGDTIDIHGKRIRLFGIDAPESSQTCTKDGAQYRCGQKASFVLADRIGHSVVTCLQRDTDRYGRVVAVCSEGGVDLNQWMVAQGYAIAYRQYSLAYVADEEKARASHLGIWAGTFQNPAEYRHGGHRGASTRINPPAETPRPQPQPTAAADEQAIIKLLMARSLAAYSGPCACPENTDRAGRRCGKRSVYSRPGGAAPLCYESDVTPAMIANYRRIAAGQ